MEGVNPIMVVIDFREFFTRLCKGFRTPDTNGSDYQKFVPKNYEKNSCKIFFKGKKFI